MLPIVKHSPPPSSNHITVCEHFIQMLYAKNTPNHPINKYKPVDICLNFKVIQENTIPVIAIYQVIDIRATEFGKLTTIINIGVYVPAIIK